MKRAAALAAVLVVAHVAATAGPLEGQPAPLGKTAPVADLQGKDVDLKALALPPGPPRGATLLVFWASWCQPCIGEIPVLNELHRYWGPRGLRVIGLGVGLQGGTLEGIKDAAEKQGVAYTVLFDRGGSMERAFGVSGLPFATLIDGAGTIRWQGNRLPGDLNRRIQKLIAPDGDRESR